MVIETQWDWYRTFEAVTRLGSLTAAAKVLGISQSTASRHLAQLEQRAGEPLLRRSPVRLTERGRALLEAVRPMLDAALVAGAVLDDASGLRGRVTITTVGEVVRWVLADRFNELFERHPHLSLRVLVDNEVTSLAAGDADLAVRMARPERGDLVVRKLGTESFALFASASVTLDAQTPWLGLAGSLAVVPEQRHVDRLLGHRPARLLVEDVESLGKAVEAGLGVAVLPRRLAAGLREVVEVRAEQVGAAASGAVPERDFWLVVHRSQRDVPKVRAVIDWVLEAFGAG